MGNSRDNSAINGIQFLCEADTSTPPLPGKIAYCVFHSFKGEIHKVRALLGRGWGLAKKRTGAYRGEGGS